MVSMFESVKAGPDAGWDFVDPERLKLFREGKNYRSRERAKGVGVLQPNREAVKEYFDFREDDRFGELPDMTTPASNTMRLTKTSMGRRSFSVRSRPATRM
jgi:hypothetical protein